MTSTEATTPYAGPERRDLTVRAQRNGLAQWLDLHPRTLAEVHGEALGALDLSLQAGRDAEERIRGLRRVTEGLRDQVRALESEALADGLTGVASRRALHVRLAQECAVLRRTDRPFAVFMVDADNLKKVNDSHGHSVGDEFLREMALRLRSTVRDMDMVARLGGDEFVIVCPGTAGAGAADLAHRLATALGADVAVAPDLALAISASIGWVIAGGDTEPARLLEMADAAMYEAKRGGSGVDANRGFIGRDRSDGEPAA